MFEVQFWYNYFSVRVFTSSSQFVMLIKLSMVSVCGVSLEQFPYIFWKHSDYLHARCIITFLLLACLCAQGED